MTAVHMTGRALLALAVLATAPLAHAQEEQAASGISIELNAMQPSDSGCRLTFVATNGLETDLDRLALEVVLFDARGLVQRMTALDFQALPAGRARVRQFDMRDSACDDISRLLVNGVSACEGSAIAADACADLSTTSRGETEFGS